ncbi:MAG TPA: AraC family transcriptional regulator [Puia sp.]|jgi:AraC-like DNA-binding protein
MKLEYKDPLIKGELRLVVSETGFDRYYFGKDRHRLLTLAWNRGEAQTIIIDEVPYVFPTQSWIPLVAAQSFRFESPSQIVAWQFNRNFYCIVDNDREISCVGLLFYGFSGSMFVRPDDTEQERIANLLEVFVEEFRNTDDIQREMLQVLLKRLIIILTRIARRQYASAPGMSDDKLDTIRHFNLLVEQHYREHHDVSFYAGQLNKSPKTLANLFLLYGQRTPQATIRERLLLEAQRLLIFTAQPIKEMASELGFADTAHFSNFFKRHTQQSPLEFRAAKQTMEA